jgi:putative DNA primase/helicase
LCGGKDRWRWDNREGRGTWICSKCGAGDGISLVMQKNRWEFREAAEQIDTVIGSASVDSSKRQRSDREKRDAMNKLWQSSKTVHANTWVTPVTLPPGRSRPCTHKVGSMSALLRKRLNCCVAAQ